MYAIPAQRESPRVVDVDDGGIEPYGEGGVWQRPPYEGSLDDNVEVRLDREGRDTPPTRSGA